MQKTSNEIRGQRNVADGDAMRIGQRGFTLMETMMTLGIVAAMVMGTTAITLNTKRMLTRSIQDATRFSEINTVVDALRNNPYLYQVTFDTSLGPYGESTGSGNPNAGIMAYEALPWSALPPQKKFKCPHHAPDCVVSNDKSNSEYVIIPASVQPTCTQRYKQNDCNSAEMRFGYLFQPVVSSSINGLRGLYIITVKTSPTNDPKDDQALMFYVGAR